MNKRMTIPLLGALLLAPGTVGAQQDQSDLRQVYQMGKDIARLEEEMKEMKELLQQLLELDRQRVALLSRAIEGRATPVSSRRPPPPPTETPPPSSERSSRPTRGTIAGNVKLSSGLSTAFVYVENVRGNSVRNRTIEVAQQNKQFAPRWAVVQKGTRVRFPNLDSIYHNVFSRSDTATFDLGIYRAGDDAKSYVFTQPGTVEIFCNMHSKMSAEILVVPNNLYTRVGSDGAFALKNVPRGRRKLVAWAPNGEVKEQWVNVEGGETANVAFELDRRKEKKHLNKYNQPYGSYEK